MGYPETPVTSWKFSRQQVSAVHKKFVKVSIQHSDLSQKHVAELCKIEFYEF